METFLESKIKSQKPGNKKAIQKER